MNYHANLMVQTAAHSADAEGKLFVPRVYNVGGEQKLHWDHVRENDITTKQDIYIRLVNADREIYFVRLAVYRSYEAFAYEVERTGVNIPDAITMAIFPSREVHAFYLASTLRQYGTV